MSIIPIRPENSTGSIAAARPTIARETKSRRPFGRSSASRRTLGRNLPSRRTFGRYNG